VDDAKKFLADAEDKLMALGVEDQHANWIHENFITDDSDAISSKADQRAIDASVQLAKDAVRFDKVQLPDDMARKMKLLKIGLVLATPSDPKESEEVTKLGTSLDSTYGKGKYCPDRLKNDEKKKCLDIEDITKIMATSTKPDELLDVWKGWHAISPPMRKDFARFVQLSNKGASELGRRSVCESQLTGAHERP
jgi:peptidyl-dipeptidase A